MSKERITTISLQHIEDLPAIDEAEWTFLANMSDAEVISRAQNDPDAQPTSVDDLKKFRVRTIDLGADVTVDRDVLYSEERTG